MKRNSGFSLIEVTVGMALVAGMGMMVSQLIQWQSKSARGVASVMDRNDLNTRLSVWLGDDSACPKVFGSKTGSPYVYTPATASAPLPAPAPQDVSSLFEGAFGTGDLLTAYPNPSATPNQNYNKSFYATDIKLVSQDNLPPSVVAGVITYKLNLNITLKKMRNGVASSSNGSDNHNVGGDSLKDLSIPVVLKVDNTGKIAQCSSTGAASALDCSSFGQGYGSIFDTGKNAMVCKKLSCDTGKFAVGTDANGDVSCCPSGQHFAGTVDGTAKCCDAQQSLVAPGVCSTTPGASCNSTTMSPRSPNAQGTPFPKTINQDGSTYCCDAVKGPPGNRSTANCSNDEIAQDGYAEGYNGVALQTISVGQHSIYSEVQGSGSANAGGNCCKMIAAVTPNFHTDPGTPPNGWSTWDSNSGTYKDDQSKCSPYNRVWNCVSQCVVQDNCAALGPNPRYVDDGCGGCQLFNHGGGGGGSCVPPQHDDGYGNCVY